MKRLTGWWCSGTIRPRMRSAISAGANVMESSAANSMPKVLVKASGWNSRPACPLSVKTGRKATAMMSSEKKMAGVTSRLAAVMAFRRSLGGALGDVLQLLVRVLDHHDLRVDRGADGDGDAAQAHDVGGDVEHVHRDEGQQHRDRQREDGQQRAAHVQQEDEDDQGDDDRLLEQRALQRVDRAVDELGAVVGGPHLHALGQGGLQLVELLLDAIDDARGVLAVAHHHDAAHRLALAVRARPRRGGCLGRSATVATSASRTGVPVALVLTTTFPSVSRSWT